LIDQQKEKGHHFVTNSLSSSHKEEEEEEHGPYFQEDAKKATRKSNLTLPCHHVVHVISVMSCRVMSHPVPHHLWIM